MIVLFRIKLKTIAHCVIPTKAVSNVLMNILFLIEMVWLFIQIRAKANNFS